MKLDNTQRIDQDIARKNSDVIKEASGGGSSRPGKPTPQKDRDPAERKDSPEREGAGAEHDDDANLDTDIERGGGVKRSTGFGQRQLTW
jgi:hypothetical protein